MGHQCATQVSSNQYLFDPDEYAYVSNHYVPTDHSQTWTGSAGASYRWMGTLFSTDMFFGSGLRDGFANLGTVPAYALVNFGVSHDFKWAANEKPLTVRFDVINALDSIYELGRATGWLATVVATASFVGLFGAVWGVTNAFIGIAKHHTINLAVIAPGLAEALLTTALGLAAAIPAVVFYNALARAIAGARARYADGSAAILRAAGRDLDRQTSPRAARSAAAE